MSTEAARHPGPIAANDGVATRLMKELGYSNLGELALGLDEPHPTVRAWNSRGSLPERIGPKVEKLRAARARARKSAKP